MDKAELLKDLNVLHTQLFTVAFNVLTSNETKTVEEKLVDHTMVKTIQEIMKLIDDILVKHGDV